MKEIGFEDPAQDRDPLRGFLNTNEVLDSIKRGDSTPWNSIQAAPLTLPTGVTYALNPSYTEVTILIIAVNTCDICTLTFLRKFV
jgi:hypothetical protein